MAKQKGPLFITGTQNGICFYEMDGEYYARRKSSLSGKRVKRDPAFKLTMIYAGLMAQASQLAATVYRSLPKDKRKHALYRVMVGKALELLKQGKDAEAIRDQLQQAYVVVKPATAPVHKQASAAVLPPGLRHGKKLRVLQLRQIGVCMGADGRMEVRVGKRAERNKQLIAPAGAVAGKGRYFNKGRRYG